MSVAEGGATNVASFVEVGKQRGIENLPNDECQSLVDVGSLEVCLQLLVVDNLTDASFFVGPCGVNNECPWALKVRSLGDCGVSREDRNVLGCLGVGKRVSS